MRLYALQVSEGGRLMRAVMAMVFVVVFSYLCGGCAADSATQDAVCDAGASVPEERVDSSVVTFSNDWSAFSDVWIDAGPRVEKWDAVTVDDEVAVDAAMIVSSMSSTSLSRAIVLSSMLCNGQRLSMTDEIVPVLRSGMSLWHICYQTSSPVTSMHELARRRAEEVVVLHMNDVTGWVSELASAHAPRVADPWTANFLLALSSDARPFFNLGSEYYGEDRVLGERLLAIQALDSGGLFQTHGIIQVWRVNADGTQTPAQPSYLCQPPSSVSPSAIPFFIPYMSCPNLAFCGLTADRCHPMF